MPNIYLSIGLIVGFLIFIYSVIKGGNWFEALIGAAFVGAIVAGLAKMGKDKATGSV